MLGCAFLANETIAASAGMDALVKVCGFELIYMLVTCTSDTWKTPHTHKLWNVETGALLHQVSLECGIYTMKGLDDYHLVAVTTGGHFSLLQLNHSDKK